MWRRDPGALISFTRPACLVGDGRQKPQDASAQRSPIQLHDRAISQACVQLFRPQPRHIWTYCNLLRHRGGQCRGKCCNRRCAMYGEQCLGPAVAKEIDLGSSHLAPLLCLPSAIGADLGHVQAQYGPMSFTSTPRFRRKGAPKIIVWLAKRKKNNVGPIGSLRLAQLSNCHLPAPAVPVASLHLVNRTICAASKCH